MKAYAILFQPLTFLLGILLLSMPCHADRVESKQYKPEVSRSVSGNSAKAFLGSGYPSLSINLPSIQADLNSPISGVKKSGVVVSLPSSVNALQLSWEPILGGYAARVHLFSEQAKRLRFHLSIPNEIQSIQFRVQGNLDASPVGPIDHSAIRRNEIWLPITNGNSADLEIFVDTSTPLEALDFAIDSANVIIADSSSGDVGGILPKKLGYAEYEEHDLECFSYSSSYSGLTIAASATAKVHFIEDGESFICSGTLLTDRGGTYTPWFATANHCIPDQAIADTATFEWFFQATSCGGDEQDPRYAQTYGGAQLLYTDVYLEPSFLKLFQQPPSGVYFSGWDTSIQVDDWVWGVHHPQGDHTMVSEGTVTSLLETVATSPSHLVDVVDFFIGGAEGGSSGSGLFSVSDGKAYWKGTLWGGPTTNYQRNYYSHFQNYYNNIKQWLENTTTLPPPTISFSASPTTVNYLGSSTLHWSSNNASSCAASGGWSGSKAVSGSQVLTSLTATQIYTLACTGNGGSTSKSVTVTVNPPPLPTVTLSASPTTVNYQGSSTLSWSSANASSCVASGGWSASKPVSGSQVLTSLTATQIYTLACTGNGGSTSKSVTVTVNPPPLPTVTLSASPTTVNYQGSSTLSWSSANASSCVASGGWSASKPVSGSQVLTSLTATQTYTLVCTGSGGSTSKSVTVTVNPPSLAQISCLLGWAERNYPTLFSPAGANTLVSSPYTYRYYRNTNAYVGVSSVDSHVYYLGSDGILRDEGELSKWLTLSSCQ